MSVVFWKELADHFSSRRFMILLIAHCFVGLVGDLCLRTSDPSRHRERARRNSFPASVHIGRRDSCSLWRRFLGFFGPLVGITLGFDSISGEYARGTLSRVLSQPIYRDSLINGKFFAGLTTVAILWGSIFCW